MPLTGAGAGGRSAVSCAIPRNSFQERTKLASIRYASFQLTIGSRARIVSPALPQRATVQCVATAAGVSRWRSTRQYAPLLPFPSRVHEAAAFNGAALWLAPG